MINIKRNRKKRENLINPPSVWLISCNSHVLNSINRPIDNLIADKLSRNRLDSHWHLGVDHSELLFDGWLQAGILSFAKISLCNFYPKIKIKKS